MQTINHMSLSCLYQMTLTNLFASYFYFSGSERRIYWLVKVSGSVCTDSY